MLQNKTKKYIQLDNFRNLNVLVWFRDSVWVSQQEINHTIGFSVMVVLMVTLFLVFKELHIDNFVAIHTRTV